MSNGYFEAYINSRTYRESANDSLLMTRIVAAVRAHVLGAQVRWAGSQRKGTAIANSDLDVIVESSVAVTEAQRRTLRLTMESSLGRKALILSHVIRLPATNDSPKVDIAFANAAFGSRQLPSIDAFHNRPARQMAARALKLWSRAGNKPNVSGWVAEAVVVHLDQSNNSRAPLELFLHIVEWLAERATPEALEGVLRPAASPVWKEEWSRQLPGRIEALKNHARSLLKRAGKRDSWKSVSDVGDWLSQ